MSRRFAGDGGEDGTTGAVLLGRQQMQVLRHHLGLKHEEIRQLQAEPHVSKISETL